jgi:hypothetical protein
MEHKFAASICILLPASKFVIDGQRDTLLELVVVVVSTSDNVASDLETKCDIEVLRDVAFGPIRDIAIRVINTDGLNSYYISVHAI